jgi:dTDP-4-dehydrorhamnose 3,5-epimerase
MLYNDPTFSDHRGSFSAIDCKEWEQTNVSLNTNKYTFRGMHYQTNPPQTKYLKVVQGSIVDILYNLKTKEVRTFQLNNQQAILVDSKYAHGFLTLEDNTIVNYLVKGKYNPESEHSIVWKDVPEIKDTILLYCKEHEITISEKDNLGK